MNDTTLGPTPPDPGLLRRWMQLLFLAPAGVGVLLPHRTPLERLAALLLLAGAAVALIRAEKTKRGGAAARGLSALATADAFSAALRATVLTGGPYSGWARAAFHAHEALTLAGIVTVPLMAVAVFLPDTRRSRLLRTCVVAGGLLLLAHLVVAYGHTRSLPLAARSEWLRLRYLFAEMTALSAACVAVWRSRRVKPRAPASADAISVGCLVAGGLALLLVGAWDRGLFGPAYSVHQAGLAAMYLVVLVVQARALRGDGRSGV